MKRLENLTEKPYFKCLACPHLGKICRGRTSDLELKHWMEFISIVCDIKGLSNNTIIANVPISLKTIKRIRACDDTQDVMRDNARLLENFVLGSADNFPCLLDLDRDDLTNEAQKFRDAIENIRAEYQANADALCQQVQFLRVENERKAKIIDKLMQ